MTNMENFDNYLKEWLRSPENAAAFLNAALEDSEGGEFFIPALKNVAKAWGSLSVLADLSNISKTTIYRTLSRRGNPDFKQLAAILDSMGLRLTVEPISTT